MGTKELLDEFLGSLSTDIEEEEEEERPSPLEEMEPPRLEETDLTQPEPSYRSDETERLLNDIFGPAPSETLTPSKPQPKRQRPIRALEEDARRYTPSEEPLESDVSKPPIPEPKVPKETIPEPAPAEEPDKAGNIDLSDRPVIKNKDETLSTIRSISFNEDGKEVLIPTVREGLDRLMSDKEAIDWYHQTGEYLGKFNTVEEANAYADQLHKSQEAKLYTDKPEPIEKKPAKFESIPPAMPGYGAFAPPVRTAQPKPDEMGLPEAMVRSFGAGAADLALNIARTPQTAAEIYLALNNYTNRAINAGIKKVTGKEKGLLPEIPLESIPNIIKLNENAWDTKAVRKFAESQKEAIKEVTNSKGVVDNLAEGNFSEAGKSIGIQAAAQVPLILSMIAGGAVGAPAKVLGGFAGTTQSASDMDQYWKDVERGVAKQSPEKAAVNAAINGFIEMFGESKVTGNIIEDAMKVLTKKTSEDIAKKAVGNAVGTVVGKMLKSSGAEMTEEAFVNYSQAVMDKLFGKRDVTLLEAIKEGIEGGIIGFFTSAGTTAPLSGIAETRRQQRVAEPKGRPQITHIVDEETGETRPIGEIPGGIKPKEEYGTLADYNMDIEEFKRLPEEEQTDLLKYLAPEEQQRITEGREAAAAEEATAEKNRKAIEELEQQAKVAIQPKPEEAEGGLQRETETEIKQAEQPSAETVTEPVTKKSVPAPEEKPTSVLDEDALAETAKKIDSNEYNAENIPLNEAKNIVEYLGKRSDAGIIDDITDDAQHIYNIASDAIEERGTGRVAEEVTAKEPIPVKKTEMYKAGVEYGKDPTAEKIPKFKNNQERMDFWSAAKETIEGIGQKEESEPALQEVSEPEVELKAETEEAEQPEGKTKEEMEQPAPVTEKKPVPKKPIPKPEKKEKPSAKETGKTVGETGRKEGIERGEEGRIRVRDTEKYGLETKTGKEIKTPKGVTAEVKNISKKTNLNNEKAYEPVLDLNKKSTGWIRPKNNKSVLIDPTSRKQVVFKAEKPEEKTAKAKTNTAASGYAIKNPLITEKGKKVTEQVRERLGIEPETKEMKCEPTGKVSRKTPVSPAKPAEGKIPKAKEKKKKVAREEKLTEKKPPVAKKTKPAPKAKKPPKEKPKFAKRKEETPPTTTEKREVTSQEKELTDVVYESADKESEYGAIQIVEDVDPESDIGVIGKVTEETTGKKVVFIKTDDRSLKSTLGFTLDGLSIPEKTEGTFKDTIFINVDSKRPLMWTAYHEFGHFLETNPDYKKRFWDAVKLTDKGKAKLAKEGQSELTTDIIGEMMSREGFWENLAKQNRSAAQKIMQEFLRIINKIAKDIRMIIMSEELTEEQKPKYEELLTDVTAVRDELAKIYSDYKKTSGKQVGKIPAKMAAAIKREKVLFAKKEEGKPEKKKPEPPVRKEPLNPFKKIREKKISDDKNLTAEERTAYQKLEEMEEDTRKIRNKGIKDRLSNAWSYIGEWGWDRSYYAKHMFANSAEGNFVIGKMNAVKSFNNKAKQQFEDAALKIIRNLPYELEGDFEKYLAEKRISEIEKLKGQGKIKHPKGMTESEADAIVNYVENKMNKKDALGIKIAAARYWRAMLDQLEQLHENGIISDKLFEKLKTEGKYYSPRRFIQHIDPDMPSTGKKGRKISVRESGIQSLEEGSEEAMLLNWRLLLSETVASTQSRIARNKAAKALANYVKKYPDNDFEGEIEQPLGEEVDLIDAEGIIENTQGELLKLQNDLANATTGAQKLDIGYKINDDVEKLDLWTNRIQAAKAKGEETVFIEFKKQPELPNGKERIYFREDGEAKAIIVSKRFADSWNNNDVAINHVLAQALNLGLGGAFVRPFATGAFAPEFALTNIPRDMALQWIATQEYSKYAPIAIIQNFDNFRRVFSDAWFSKGRWRDFVNEDGGSEYLNEGTFFRKNLTKKLTPLSTRYTRIMDYMKHFQEFSERLTRLALREQAIKNGKTPAEASQIARDYLNFSQGGSLIKGLDNAVPYLNAGVQGGRAVGKALITEPVPTLEKIGQLMMMGAALALVATKFRREEWDDIYDRDKVGRWNFPLGMSFKNDLGEDQHIYLSIPKDQSSRLWATIGEVSIDLLQGAIDGETAWRRVVMAFDDLSPIDMIGILPPVPSAIAGYYMNKNFWKKEDIWTGRENMHEYMEYYPGRTPKAYIDLSEQLYDIGVDLSPERMHQSLQQTLPKSIYSSLMGGLYETVTAQLSKEDKQTLDKKVYQHWSQFPVIRKFIRATYPSKTDYEKFTEKLIDYRIPLYNKKGQKKSETMLKHEIREKEKDLNTLRQQHDNEMTMITNLFFSKKKLGKEQLTTLLKDANKEMGPKEVKRILRKMITTMKKPAHAKFYEAHRDEIQELITQYNKIVEEHKEKSDKIEF